MFYKPKYCCNCGEEIEIADRSILSSGRFCDICKDDFKPQEWLPRITVLGGIVLALFGVGSFLQPSEKPLTIAAKQLSEAAPNPKNELKDSKIQMSGNPNIQNPVSSNSRVASEKLSPTAKTLSEQKGREIIETKVSDQEPTYFCGAATKKGSPCSRRVKNNERCWQHAGQTAILPPEKLLISR